MKKYCAISLVASVLFIISLLYIFLAHYDADVYTFSDKITSNNNKIIGIIIFSVSALLFFFSTIIIYDLIKKRYENNHDYINAIMPLVIAVMIGIIAFSIEFSWEDVKKNETDSYVKQHYFIFILLFEVLITLLYYILNSIFVLKKQHDISHKVISDKEFYSSLVDFSNSLSELKEKKESGKMSSVESDLIRQRIEWVINDMNSYKESEFEFFYKEYSIYWEKLIKQYVNTEYFSIEDHTITFDLNCGGNISTNEELHERVDEQAEALKKSDIQKFEKVIVYNTYSVTEGARTNDSCANNKCEEDKSTCHLRSCDEYNCSFNYYIKYWCNKIEEINSSWKIEDQKRDASLYIVDYHCLDNKLRLETLDIGIFGEIAAGEQVNDIVRASESSENNQSNNNGHIKFTFYFKREKVKQFREFYSNIKNSSLYVDTSSCQNEQ